MKTQAIGILPAVLAGGSWRLVGLDGAATEVRESQWLGPFYLVADLPKVTFEKNRRL